MKSSEHVPFSPLSKKSTDKFKLKNRRNKGKLASAHKPRHVIEADRKSKISNGKEASDSNGPMPLKSKKKRKRKKSTVQPNVEEPMSKKICVGSNDDSTFESNPTQNRAAPASPDDKINAESNAKYAAKKKGGPSVKAQKGKSGKFNRTPFQKPTKVVQTIWGMAIPKRPKTSKRAGSLPFDDLGGFEWNATSKDLANVVSGIVKSDSEDEEEEEAVVKRKKLTPAEKRAKVLEEERKMKRKERELLEAEENPQSPDHFERLLVGSPNSAELWIKYMGYHILNADVEKARAVARRAIKRIDPQLTTAKLDVWIAFINLESTFSPPEVFKDTVSEALKCNDDFVINSRVLSLYADAKNVTEVDQLTNFMVKKYKTNLENWLLCQNALMTVGLQDKARNLLQKALTVLTKKEHVTLISRFALLENKHGFPEQAQALFENLMTSFPQRLDILSVYVDMLVKSNLVDLSRSVLERAASNSLPVRKMKSIYLKWIAFEEAHGTAQDVAKVEEAAKKYVSDMLRPSQVKGKNTPPNDVMKKEESDAYGDELDLDEFSDEE